MEFEELRQQSTGSFRELYDADSAQTQLHNARFRFPFYLFGFTVLCGIIPLFFRWALKPTRMRWYLSKIRRTPKGRGFVQLLLCILGGQLLVLIFMHILPMARSYIRSDHVDPYLEGFLCASFVLTFLLQDVIFMRFGNTDSLYTHQCHMCIVQFIRCELNLTSEILPWYDDEDSKADSAENDPISVDDLQLIQEVLDISASEAKRLQARVRANPRMQDVLPVKHWRKLSDALRRKNPRMDPTACIGVILLSLHSIPDGIFMNLQSDADLTMFAFMSLLFHRCLISVLIAIELVAKNFSTKAVLFVVLAHSLTAPIGGLVASAIAEGAGFENMAFMMSVSGGSLLYVVIFELFKSDKGPYLMPAMEAFHTLLGGCISFVLHWVATRKSHFWNMFV